mgnify:CR=1 FL=1
MLTVYGLKTCDTCRKARKWLAGSDTTHIWLDVRSDGIRAEDLSKAINWLGWEKVLNKSSTTWRQLEDKDKEALDADKATALILSNPALMKRPLFLFDNAVVLGFNAASISALEKLL